MKKSTVIYGPPGTGKSTEIIRRMKEALKAGTPADRIGLCSFTRAAAAELAVRAGVKAGANISTLHSYAFRLLGLTREQVVGKALLAEFSRMSGIVTTGANIYEQEELGPGDYYLAMYGYMRSVMCDPSSAYRVGSKEGTYEEFLYFIEAYDKWKAANGFVDFPDMLTNALDAPVPQLDILFLDEAQDFAPAQWKLIEAWLPYIDEVVLALDDDQTLYRFTGADPEGGPRFEQENGSDRVVLKQSYRVPSVIHTMACEYIKRVSSRVEKEYLPLAEGGTIQRYGSIDTIPPPDHKENTLILYRNHSLSEPVREWLMERGIPFVVDNGKPGPLNDYLAEVINLWCAAQKDYQAMGQPFLKPMQVVRIKKAIKPQYLHRLNSEGIDSLMGIQWQALFRMPMKTFDYYNRIFRRFGTLAAPTKIHLSSIHGAKGREADRVVLLNDMSVKTAASYAHDPDPEIRAFYVGMTRAKHRLDIVYGDNPVTGI